MSEHIQTGIAGSDTVANQVLVSICEHQGMSVQQSHRRTSLHVPFTEPQYIKL